MIRRLLLLRHAKAVRSDSEFLDKDRPLRRRGRRMAAAMRDLMRAYGMVPDQVLASSARRTVETMAALRPWKHAPAVEITDALYLAPASRILEILRDADASAHTILVIGHNPGLHDLARHLVGADAMRHGGKLIRQLAKSFPVCALAELTFTCPWLRIGPGAAKLANFVRPRDVR